MTTDCIRPNCKCCPRCGSIKRPCDECCYCAPSALCFRVVDEYGEAITAAKLLWDEDLALWTGTLTCGNDEATIEVSLSADDYGDCYWHVFSYALGLDDQFPAGSEYSEHDCSPSIDIPDVCGGTAQIRAEEWVTPDYHREYGESCPDYFCSSCKCLCYKLCFIGKEYEWNGGGGWDGPLGTITIHRDDYSGACVITAPGYEPFELAEGHNCTSLSISLTELDGYGTETLTCWNCTCEKEIPCPLVCVGNGNILVGCGALSEYPVFYLLGNSDRSPLLLNDGSPTCCDYPAFLANDEGTCIWVDGSPDPGECEWTFHPEDGPKVQLKKDGFTWVWTVDGDFDPLCTSVFVYNPDQSNPDPDCDVYTELCVTPNNACCDGGEFRDTPMPEVLHAEGLHCCGINPNDPTPPIPFDFDLTWDPSDKKWKGETPICSGYLRVHVTCICGTSEGCGQPSDPCYQVQVWFKCSIFAEIGPAATVENCSCDPFELEVSVPDIFTQCCAAEVLIDLNLTIFE